MKSELKKKIKAKMATKSAKRRKKASINCPVCHKEYKADEDNDDAMLGRWIGCQECETWAHGLCVGFSPADVKERDWFCPKH